MENFCTCFPIFSHLGFLFCLLIIEWFWFKNLLSIFFPHSKEHKILERIQERCKLRRHLLLCSNFKILFLKIYKISLLYTCLVVTKARVRWIKTKTQTSLLDVCPCMAPSFCPCMAPSFCPCMEPSCCPCMASVPAWHRSLHVIGLSMAFVLARTRCFNLC